MSEEKTKFLYEKLCMGYRGESHPDIPQHKFWTYDKPLVENSHGVCLDCYVLFKKDIEKEKAKRLEEKL